jgi:hypothetical protein
MLMAARSVPFTVLMPNRLPDTAADHLNALPTQQQQQRHMLLIAARSVPFTVLIPDTLRDTAADHLQFTESSIQKAAQHL